MLAEMKLHNGASTTPLCRPFEIGKDGTRDYAIESFCDYYSPRKLSLQEAVAELDGKVLECFCMPERCHGEPHRPLLACSHP